MSAIGTVIEASYSEGLLAILKKGENVEDYPIGSLVIVDSGQNKYLTIISDVRYISKFPSRVLLDLPEEYAELAISSISSRDVECYLSLIPISRYSVKSGVLEKPDTVPQFGSKVLKPTVEDLSKFYGIADALVHYPLGKPKVAGEIDYSVPIDVGKLFELSFGLYGKSGSGKTFLMNLLIGYAILYAHKTKLKLRFLIFDMHDEYSVYIYDDFRRPVAEGIANVFRDAFKIYSPDSENCERYNMEYLPIPLYDISAEQLLQIAKPLELPEGFVNNAKQIENKVRSVFRTSGKDDKYWMLGLLFSSETLDRYRYKLINDSEFIEPDRFSKEELGRLLKSVEMEISKNRPLDESFTAGRRRLIRLLDMPISFKEEYRRRVESIVDNLLEEDGYNVVVSMGKYERNEVVYFAIANIIGEAMRLKLQKKAQEGIMELPTKVVVVLEEAHKFLGKGLGEYSPFGIIAREMRKRGVIVIPIDQKPSELDPNVTSMLWTTIVLALTDPRDIEAATVGLERADLFKPIISSLRRGEALVYGTAVRHPVVLKVEDYSKVVNWLEEGYKSLKRGMLKQEPIFTISEDADVI